MIQTNRICLKTIFLNRLQRGAINTNMRRNTQFRTVQISRIGDVSRKFSNLAGKRGVRRRSKSDFNGGFFVRTINGITTWNYLKNSNLSTSFNSYSPLAIWTQSRINWKSPFANWRLKRWKLLSELLNSIDSVWNRSDPIWIRNFVVNF